MKTEDRAAPAPQTQTLAQGLKRLTDRIFSWSAGWVSQPYWILKVVLFCAAFSILFTGGLDMQRLKEGYPDGYYAKVQHPLLNMLQHSAPEGHDAKLNFRLTVPVLLHPLGFSPGVVLHVVLPVLTMIGACGVVLFTCLAAFRITGDRVTAFLMALNACSTYPGSFACIGFYDSIALAQLTLAMLPGLSPVVLGGLVFTASFTDERAFIAAGLLLVREFCLAAEGPKTSWFWNGRALAVALGMVGYWVVRLLLAFAFGLGSTGKGIGVEVFVFNVQFWHLGAWSALKGGWLLVFLAALALWQQGQQAKTWVFLLAVVLVVGCGFLTGDVIRSVAYAYPAVLIALAVICRGESAELVRRYCLLAAGISVLGGIYNILWGKVTWCMPLLVQLINCKRFSDMPSFMARPREMQCAGAG
jgi:hypothetical protein